MTTPLFLLPAPALDGLVPGAEVELTGAEGHHAVAVRRIRAGERVDVGDGAGRVARCTVTGHGRDRLVLRVLELAAAQVRQPRLVLVQALAKGGRDELAVQTATELGVDAIMPWRAERSVVVWQGERGVRAHRRWQDIAAEAAKQSRRLTVPAVLAPVSTAELAGLLATPTPTGGPAPALVLHEEAELPLAAVELPPAGTEAEVLVVVGPEGGIGAAELERLTAAGAIGVRLGPEVLRSSSAGPAALAVLSARLGRWG